MPNRNVPVPPELKAVIDAVAAQVRAVKPISIPRLDLTAFAKAHKDALTLFPEIQKRVAVQIQPLAELQRQLAQISLPTQRFLQDMAENAKRVQAILPRPRLEHIRILEQVAKTDRRKRVLDRLNLLPHASTPFALLDGNEADEVLKAKVEQHYRDNWQNVSENIQKRAEKFDVDEEAKAVLVEALQAHGNGHYRSVCRLLLPEIERVARVELLGNSMGTIRIQEVIGEPAMELPISQTNPPGYYALGLYERLTDHIYVKVDANNRGKLEADTVPNRHAAIHGLIVYNSFWHSLNTIFMTDFALQVVSAIKGLGSTSES